MRLVVRPKLKTKLETKAFREAAKLLRLAAGDKEAFTGRLVAYALLSLSRHCKMNLLISGANREKKKKKSLIQRERKKNPNWPSAGAGWGGLVQPELDSSAEAAVRSEAPAHHPPPAPGMLIFISLPGPIMTYIICL